MMPTIHRPCVPHGVHGARGTRVLAYGYSVTAFYTRNPVITGVFETIGHAVGKNPWPFIAGSLMMTVFFCSGFAVLKVGCAEYLKC